MDTLPHHVGRQVDVETGWALVCNATPDGNPQHDPICGQPARWHIRWEAATTENGLACEEHLNFALGFGPHQVHSVDDSACGMPCAAWVEEEPSHCSMPVLDERPALAGAAPVPVSVSVSRG